MGGSASIESGYITIIDADTKNVIIKLRNVNLKKIWQNYDFSWKLGKLRFLGFRRVLELKVSRNEVWR